MNLFLPERIYFAMMRYEMFIFIGLFVILWTGILDGPLYFLNNLVLRGLDFLTGFVDLIAQLVMHI